MKNTEFVMEGDAICFGQRNGEIFQNIEVKFYNYLWQDGTQTSDRENY
ncbi:MAG: hypothetical protein IPN13_14795 [Bacteroidetes bacterium]|nr:hypothetical protein [Bacteroidota bacterium]